MLKTFVIEKVEQSSTTALERIGGSSRKKPSLNSVSPLMDSPNKKVTGRSNTSAHDVSGTTKSTLGKGYKDKSEHKTEDEEISLLTQPQDKLDLAIDQDTSQVQNETFAPNSQVMTIADVEQPAISDLAPVKLNELVGGLP